MLRHWLKCGTAQKLWVFVWRTQEGWPLHKHLKITFSEGYAEFVGFLCTKYKVVITPNQAL